MNIHPTPVAGGAWRVIDGQLVNEAEAAAPEPAPAPKAPSVPSKPGRASRQNPQPSEE